MRKWGSESEVGAGPSASVAQPVVAPLASGGWLLAWSDSAGPGGAPAVRFQRFDAFGQPLGAEGVLPAASEPALVALAGGGLLLAAEVRAGPVDRDIFGWRIDAAGQLLGGLAIDDARGPDASEPALARLGSGAVAVQEIGGDLQARMLDADGRVQAGPLPVTTAPGLQILAEVSELAGGGFVVTWTDGNLGALRGRVFAADGSQVTPSEIAINTSGLGANPGTAAVAGLAGGGFVVAWESDAALLPIFSPDIRARLFSPDGTPLGAEFTVNAGVAGAQRLPEVVALRDGRFVVVWTDLTGEPSLRGQIFDGAGARVGREFTVSTSPLPGAPAPEDVTVAELADGRLLLAWRGLAEGGPQIHQQVLDPRDGVVTGTAGGDLLAGHDALGDEISGLGGGDTLAGLRGDDMLYGGAGGDLLRGDRGDDGLWGGTGADTLVGGRGEDDLFGGAGTDLAVYATPPGAAGVTAALDGSLWGTGEATGDSFAGVEGLRGGEGADRLRGSAGGNLLQGAGDGDTLEGLSGEDTLQGGAGNDILEGGQGQDDLQGDQGADRLLGGAGADLLLGGGGADVFVLRDWSDSPGPAGADRILDLRRGEDRLSLAALDADPVAAGRQAFRLDADGILGRGEIRQVRAGADLWIEINGNADPLPEAVVVLVGAPGLLTAADFEL